MKLIFANKSIFKIVSYVLAGFLGLLAFAPGTKAAITYGNGYYVNLCDSGTAATYYSCNTGCNPQTGSCRSDNQGVVKWICYGKWDQCLESESQWSNYEQVDNVGCGYTVQLSQFDKKCRREDGSWDNTCRLTGYMVWYSGDCIAGQNPTPTGSVSPSQTPKPSVSPTAIPQVTTAPSVTIKPSPTAASKINNNLTPTVTAKPSLAAKVCNAKCSRDDDCQAGFACVSGRCRNPACTTDNTCFCTQAGATGSAVANTTPETGWPTWVGMALMGGLGWGGIKVRKLARGLWA